MQQLRLDMRASSRKMTGIITKNQKQQRRTNQNFLASIAPLKQAIETINLRSIRHEEKLGNLGDILRTIANKMATIAEVLIIQHGRSHKRRGRRKN